MRILWLCNIMLPAIAEQLHIEASNKEGWLTGLSNRIFARQAENDITLGVCFPTQGELETFGKRLTVKAERKENVALYAYGFAEDVQHAEIYTPEMEQRFREIIEDFRPDLIHCFGTEYPHTLALVKAFGRPEATLIGIQGLCAIYADHYRADLPDAVWNRRTFRDRMRRDDLRQQQAKYAARGVFEREAVNISGHVTGRTDWDHTYTGEWNPQAQYHFMNETLRANFYEGHWELEDCQPHSIFLSQGDYPIKGLHYLLCAMPEILEAYPDTEVYVAGNSIIKTATKSGIAGIKGRLKLDSYGKYIYDLIRQHQLIQKIHFLGKCNAEQMKERYLKSHVFLCPSSIENSPNSVGEAMILGMPTICARVGGIPSIFQDEVDGQLYPVADSKALAKAVTRAFAGGSEIERMAEHAREHAGGTHDPEQNYQTLLQIYQTIMIGNTKEDKTHE